MRIVSFLLLGCLVALSFVIYEVKYQTRAMDHQVAALQLDIRKERDAIAVLRAEWSHLNRPGRIERLARKHLGLKPVQARQMMTLGQLAASRRNDRGRGNPDTGPLTENTASNLRHSVRAIQ